ncbi:hypothetical protein PsorP6_008943 [Peronosclerospora sorghi]|uniref:Uncharacterized protein n=1 Tax=Peronosclerospora sorghi TaxID=230839 RepID=A0ACC0W1K6_9STRA|nr:hypothetical protein PsorP6_008943 [Peronosclerospora sorghi]
MSLHLPKHHWGTRSMGAYEKLECIGAGTYGQVYMAKDKATGEVVAIKKIRSLNEVQGLPVTTIREIKVLKCLNHPNLVELKEVVVSSENDDDDGEFREKVVGIKGKKDVTDVATEFTDRDEPLDYCHGSIYLVLEYLEHDLTGLIDRQYSFDDMEIKCLMKQLLEVMEYMHSIDIIHRDIKCSNLLMTRDHILKVADFGLARSLRGDQLFTNKVVTLWYRPPELLLGATSYDASIDMWSIGCVFAELYIGHPIFQGKTELEQITKIFDICGTPTTESWPDYKFLTHSSSFVPEKPKPKRLREYLMREATARKRILPKGALELMEALLVLDPEQRLTASDCLRAQYFSVRPLPPDDPKKLPPITNLPPSHEYQTKKIRREQAKKLNGGGATSTTGAGSGRNPLPTSPCVARSGSRSRPSATKEATEVFVKTEAKREEAASSSAKKKRRVI